MTDISELINNDGVNVWVPPCGGTMSGNNFKVVVGARLGASVGRGFLRAKDMQGNASGVCDLSVDELRALAVACMQAVQLIEKARAEGG